MKDFFNGVCTAMVTPFNRDGLVDYETLGKLVNRQIELGIDALCILGTTGEATTLTFDEKIAIAKMSVEIIANRVPIIFGIGGNNPKEIIKLGRALKSISENIAVLLTPPYYNKCTQDGAVKWFDEISKAIDLPTIIYNVPSRAGMNLLPETIERIARNKRIVGIKQATSDIAQIIETVRLCPNLAVYSGDDGLALPCYAVGCRGIISVASNIDVKETRDIFATHSAQKFLSQIPKYNALFCETNPAPVKYAMSVLGLCEPYVRSPLTIPNARNKKIICTAFGGLDTNK